MNIHPVLKERNVRRHSVLALMVPTCYTIISGWMVGVRFEAEEGFSLRHHVQTGPGAQPTFYLMNTAASFPPESGHSMRLITYLHFVKS
jgi:hypothetical protein